MVQSVSKIQEPTVEVTEQNAGKVHQGFTLALALAAPGGMLLAAALVALLINGSQGETGMLWLGAAVLLPLWGGLLGGAMLLAEAEG